MTILKDKKCFVERDGRSAIYSHQKKFRNNVHTICHHSGRYLTRDETNPTPLFFWKEQHDFPGLPKLDHSFQKAAHSQQHEHWIWSHPGIQGTAFIVSSILIIYLLLRASTLTNFISGGFWWAFTWGLFGLSMLAAIYLAGRGLYLITQRHQIFHKNAGNMPPAAKEFPIECTFEIEVEEILKATLGNVHPFPSNCHEFNGRITTQINPTQNDLETFADYQKQYRTDVSDEPINAGAIGIEGLDGIQFEEDNVDFDHRLLLKSSSTNLKLDVATDRYKPFAIGTNYRAEPMLIFPFNRGDQQLPLQCEPRISHQDSRMLELVFSWHGVEPVSKIVLETCILDDIPAKLKPVTRVIHGRFDQALDDDDDQVIWRNLPFQPDYEGIPRLSLSVSFEHPLLDCIDQIKGSYVVRLNGLISHLEISDEHIWTAWGAKAKPSDSLIRKKATVMGNLSINPQLLSQEHEHVTNVAPLICAVPPNGNTVKKIMNVLLDEEFDLHHISQAPSRLHPTGRLDARLGYWDIAGRHYDQTTLAAIDVHVVISGYRHISRISTKESIDAQTKIDVRLRCLHDPRNPRTANHADTMMGTDFEEVNGKRPLSKSETDPLIPHPLFSRLRNVLLQTGEFTQSRQLHSLFVDGRIAQWQHNLPERDTPADRVEAIIEDFLQLKNNKDENALILLLETLKSRTSESEEMYGHLSDLVHTLADLPLTSSKNGEIRPSTSSIQQSPDTFGLITRIRKALACEGAETQQ